MNKSRNKLSKTAFFLAPVMLVLSGSTAAWSQRQTDQQRPSFQQVQQIAATALSQRDDYAPGDLITRRDVQRVLKALMAAPWRPPDHQQLMKDVLPEDDALVRMLNSRQGVKFMRKVKDDALIYDRMDRVCRVSGGQRMLADIARLPGGEKLAKMKRPHGVPGFLDLLPKNASGKVRSIKDYGEATGRIYTQKQLLERLKDSYQGQDATTSRKW